MGSTSHGRAVSAALDPILVPAGFAAAQYSENAEDGWRPSQVIFCADAEELSSRYPWLPQAVDYDPEHDMCFDLIVSVTNDGTIDDVELEVRALEWTLREIGGTAEADAAGRLTGTSLLESLPVLQQLLPRLFERPAAEPTAEPTAEPAAECTAEPAAAPEPGGRG